MRSRIKLETVSRKCIKPSSQTPPQHEIFKLSLLDQLSPNIHGNMTFFYPHNPLSVIEFPAKSKLLQDSLSHVLTLFYPLAGRLRDPSTIHCNDHGASFIESRTDAVLSEILAPPDFDTLQHLLPVAADTETEDSSMLVVRFTLFGCGATALTVSLSHKIADFATLIAFLRSWTAACRSTGDSQPVVPDLAAGAALFPPREIPGMSASVNTAAAQNFTTRRLVFEASKIQELKNRVENENPEETMLFQPSRVEVVLALIWRCALLSSKPETAPFKPSALFQAVNLRPRMEEPYSVPETAIGNFVWAFAVTVEEERELEFNVLVKKMRKGMRKFLETKAVRFKEEGGFGVVMESLKERGEVLKKREIQVYKCSSWCNFPVNEVVDFGWEKPPWMCSVNKMVSNTIALMDTVTTRDGVVGIEAFVTLDEQHMPCFQQNHELLRYALLNPSIL